MTRSVDFCGWHLQALCGKAILNKDTIHSSCHTTCHCLLTMWQRVHHGFSTAAVDTPVKQFSKTLQHLNTLQAAMAKWSISHVFQALWFFFTPSPLRHDSDGQIYVMSETGGCVRVSIVAPENLREMDFYKEAWDWKSHVVQQQPTPES